MASTGSASPGLSITGELRGGRVEEGRPREQGEGKWPDRYILTVLAGEDSFRIEYRDEAAAQAAVGPGAQVGDLVTVPVTVRAARSFVFYVGKGAGTGVEAPDLSWNG